MEPETMHALAVAGAVPLSRRVGGQDCAYRGGDSAALAVRLSTSKKVFKVAKVITAVSGSEMDQVEHRLGKGVVDQIIDHTKQDPCTAIPPRSVHFALDTADQTLEMLPIMAESSGFIASISTLPSAESLEGHLQLDYTKVSIPPLLRTFLDAGERYRQWRASSHGVGYAFTYPVPNAEDLGDIARWAEEGRIRSVVGATVRMGDVEQTVKVLQEEFEGGGGVGKTVLEML